MSLVLDLKDYEKKDENGFFLFLFEMFTCKTSKWVPPREDRHSGEGGIKE